MIAAAIIDHLSGSRNTKPSDMSKKVWKATGAAATVILSAGTGLVTNYLTTRFSWALATTLIVLVAGSLVLTALISMMDRNGNFSPAAEPTPPRFLVAGPSQPPHYGQSPYSQYSSINYVSGGRATQAGRDVRNGMPPVYALLSILIVAVVAVSALFVAVKIAGRGEAAGNDGISTNAPLMVKLTDNRGSTLGCPISDYYFSEDISTLESSVPASMKTTDAAKRAPAFDQWVTQEKGWRQTNWVEFTVQSNSPSSVILTKLSINVVGDTPLTSRAKLADGDGCGSPGVPRTFEINFAGQSPRVKAIPGDEFGQPIPAVKFPFKVSATDPEIFDLTVAAGPARDIQWTATLAYTQNGQNFEAAVTDGGKPFHSVPHDDIESREIINGVIQEN